MNLLKKYLASIIFGLLIIGATFFSGAYVGTQYALQIQAPDDIKGSENGKPSGVDFSPFWKVWNTLDEKFVNIGTSTPATNEERVWGAIQGLVNSTGDPYTVFFPPAEAKMFEDDISGNFEGVGMEVAIRDGILTVVSPLKGTPAYRAGIKAGDRIVAIDGLPTSDLSVDEAVKKIRGPVGTPINLTVVHSGENQSIQIKIVRDVINIPTIDTEIKEDVFIIRLYNFSANSTNLFRNALRDFIRSGTGKLIVDLRGNPGGYLEAAIDMTSWFLPAGEIIVREDFGDKFEETEYRSKGYDIFNEKLKMVILIDSGSASASEILAGALREHGKATLIGTKTFGKGSVQELVPITSDTSLKVTVAKWLTPKGVSLSENGLEPDIEVELTEKDTESGKDPQLDRAIEFLLKK